MLNAPPWAFVWCSKILGLCLYRCGIETLFYPLVFFVSSLLHYLVVFLILLLDVKILVEFFDESNDLFLSCYREYQKGVLLQKTEQKIKTNWSF
jgi:type IV secretory pathway VirB3-like protein